MSLRVEILISTMFKEDLDFLKPMFQYNSISDFDIIIVNQTTKDKIIDLEDGLINKKMIYLINELDEAWQTLSLEKIRFILFQLEFSLKVLLKKAEGQLYILLQALLTKLDP